MALMNLCALWPRGCCVLIIVGWVVDVLPVGSRHLAD